MDRLDEQRIEELAKYIKEAFDFVGDLDNHKAIAACLYGAGYRRYANAEEEIDKIAKVNMWLMEKYVKDFREYCRVEEGDSALTICQKTWDKMDEIHKEMNKKYPVKWYELCFFGGK